MFHTGVPAAFLVPPVQGPLVGAVHAVKGRDTPAFDDLIGLGTASRVEKQRVVTRGQGDVIIPRGPDGADVPHTVHRLEHPQHPGNAALGAHLVEYIRLSHPRLGERLFQIVQHHGVGPALCDVLRAALPGEGIDIGQRLRRLWRLRKGRDLQGEGKKTALRRGVDRGRFPAGGQQQETQQKDGNFLHKNLYLYRSENLGKYSRKGPSQRDGPKSYRCQISRLYSMMVRSEEKNPDLAIFTSVLADQSRRSS